MYPPCLAATKEQAEVRVSVNVKGRSKVEADKEP